jgi:hypothetical protein
VIPNALHLDLSHFSHGMSWQMCRKLTESIVTPLVSRSFHTPTVVLVSDQCDDGAGSKLVTG